MVFDPKQVRSDFPILSTQVHGHPLVYLDNGATTQKPGAVIDAIGRYYEHQNANIHRGVYQLSQLATTLYEQARHTVAQFINAAGDREIIFTRGTTEGINLVAITWSRGMLKPGDEIVVSAMEHHSNIVPWQIAAQVSGAVLRVIPINDAGELQLDELERILAGGRVKLVAVTHLSNALGTINDVKRIATMAHAAGAAILVDGAQWVAHAPTDVRDIDADFYVFSGHKLYGPTGIGVLYGKASWLERMPPFQGGGDMIESVSFSGTTYAGLPNKFEAGTPNIAGAVGLAAAIDYVNSIGFDHVIPHERSLLRYATQQLQTVPGLRLIGTAAHKASVLSFVLEDPKISSFDIGVALDRYGIAIRTGHHCCQPVMERMHIDSTARASLAMYNTTADVDALTAALCEFVDAEQVKRATPRLARKAAAAAGPAGSVVSYPPAFADSPADAADALAGDFELLGEPDDRNAYLIDMGENLPPLFDLLKKVTPRVPGCMSEVYLVARAAPADGDILEFVADANADVVRGLIALLQRLFSGQRAAAVLAFDIDAFFHRIGLEAFLSSQRRNGLAGMVAKLRQQAKAIVEKQPATGAVAR
jgi:cysteine desulfurase/selenocysteine lyase